MDLANLSPTTVLTALLVVLVLALGGLYFVGAQVGQRRARDLIRVSVDLLKPVGREGTYQRLGSTGYEIRLTDLKPPFTGMRVVVWLEPRENFPLWLVNRLRGRRDLIGLAADLTNPPRGSFELVDPKAQAGRRALIKARERGWKEAAWTFAGRPLVVASPDLPEARRTLARVGAPGSVDRLKVDRLSVSTDSPQLSVTIGRPGELAASGASFVPWLARVAETAAEAPAATRPPDRARPSKLPRARRLGR